MSRIVDVEKFFEQKREILNFIKQNEEKLGFATTSSLLLSINFDQVLVPGMALNSLELEILSKFDAIKKETDVYHEFKNMLMERDFLQGNVVEVGAGRIPRLSEVIMEERPSGLVSVTAYDPLLIYDTLSGVKLVKEPFTYETDIHDANTLYGLFPCKGSVSLIDKAIDENKNLLIAFCGCDHSDAIHGRWLGDTWADDVCDEYSERYGDRVEVSKWSENVGLSYPILTYKRK